MSRSKVIFYELPEPETLNERARDDPELVRAAEQVQRGRVDSSGPVPAETGR